MTHQIRKFVFTYFALNIIFTLFISAQEADREITAPLVMPKLTGKADDAYAILNKGELINVIGNYGCISDAYLQNVLYNFTWPKSKGAETSDIGSEDATDDFSFFFATASVENIRGQQDPNVLSGTVIDGYTSYDREDWRGVDGAGLNGSYHCANEQQRDYLLAPDGTPMLSTSDIPESWPAGWMDDDEVWPGTWHPGPTGPYESLNTDQKAMVDSLAGWYDSEYDVWRFWPGKFRIDVETGNQVPGEFAGDRHVWCIMDDDDNLQGPKVGMVVEMEGICYGRPYAEDFHFYDFTIRNESGSQLDSCWWGYYIDPKFGDVSEEEFYTYNSGINPNDQYNVFIQYDPTGQTATSRWREIGVIGLAVLRTPHDIGVTDAHFCPDGSGNSLADWELWALITGNTSDPFAPQPLSDFFHGPDPHLDDFSMSWGNPTDYGFYVVSGPFSMLPGEKVKATIAVSAGADQFELLGGDHSQLESGDFAANIQTAQEMFEAKFQGPSGPQAPNLYGVPGDGNITLYWDDIPEKKPDPFSGEFDFEGYKIYRSVDDGATWGKSITNATGQIIGYVPFAQFDVENNVQGIDPVNNNNYLGNNSGIKHTLVDSTVYNGISYTYAITAYDRGDPSKPIPSYESARGTSPIESNVVRITARSDPIGYQDPSVSIESHALGNGELFVDVFQPPEIAEIYQVAFTDSPATTFNVVKEGAVLATFPMNTEKDLPLVNGIRFGLEGDTLIGGVKNITDEYGRDVLGVTNSDTTSNWFVESVTLLPITQAPLETKVADYEIRFTSDSSWVSKAGPDPQLAQFKVPFSVWNMSVEPPVQANCLVAGIDFQYDLGDPIYVAISPYTAQSEGDTISVNWKKEYAYKIIVKPTTNNTNGILPLEGQKIKLETFHGFIDSDFFDVTINPSQIKATTDEMERLLEEVRVVPNPYVVNAQWETQQNERRLRFMFLPGECDISIYTETGELVAKLEHRDGTGDEDWSMLTQVGQEIAYGLYIYVVETKDSSGREHKKIGKFIVIK